MSDTHDALQKLLEGPPLESTAFPPNSRYHGVKTLQLPAPDDGTPIVYLARRFIPQPDQFTEVSVHVVKEGERIDNLAGQLLGDPLLAWRIADANAVLRPDELTQRAGQEIRITLPAGIPGGRSNAT